MLLRRVVGKGSTSRTTTTSDRSNLSPVRTFRFLWTVRTKSRVYLFWFRFGWSINWWMIWRIDGGTLRSQLFFFVQLFWVRDLSILPSFFLAPTVLLRRRSPKTPDPNFSLGHATQIFKPKTLDRIENWVRWSFDKISDTCVHITKEYLRPLLGTVPVFVSFCYLRCVKSASISNF